MFRLSLLSIFTVISVCLYFSSFRFKVEGCHAGELAGRKRRAYVERTSEVRTFFDACLVGLDGATLWGGPVDFVVLHSEWYTTASAACNPDSNMDTVECWLEQVNDLVAASSSNIDLVKDCVIDYYDQETPGANYTGSRFPSSRPESPEDAPECPSVSLLDFESSFDSYFDSLDEFDDETIVEFDSIVDFMQNDFICPSCSCTDISVNVGTLEEYNLTVGCDNCWPTRFASMVRPGSPVALPAGLAAINNAALMPENTCPSTSIDVDSVEDLKAALDVRVECLSDRVEIRIHRCSLVTLNLRLLREFVLANSSAPINASHVTSECIPQLYTESTRNDIVYNITSSFEACGAAVTENDSAITYTYTMRTFPDYAHLDTIVSYSYDVMTSVSCSYQREINVSSTGIHSLERTLTIASDTEYGLLDVEMKLYRDLNFTHHFNVAEILVPEQIYVDVQITKKSPDLILQASLCSVSNTIPATPGLELNAIDNGCPISDDLFTISEPSVAYGQFRFSFTSFRWNFVGVPQDIYVTCDVSVCQIDENNDCQPQSCLRRKRSHPQNKAKTSKITVGPLHPRISKNKRSCSLNNGGCSHICATTSQGIPVCACPSDLHLFKDERTCKGQTEKPAINNNLTLTLTIVGCIFLVAILVLAR